MSAVVLTLHGIGLSRRQRPVLSGVDLEVRGGEIVALMGQSGSGKTTILRTIAGLETFERGSMVVGGVPVSSGGTTPSTVRALRRQVGLVFQFHCLFEHMTALENVVLAPVHALGAVRAEAERRAGELLTSLGVDHRAHALPRELSGGEAQRVAIARALAVDPPILLLDEPTASLDQARRTELASILRSLVARNRTLIVATHDEEFARQTATRVLRVSDGRISHA